mmetsp:Transcript_22399/g.63977  ORF Transcript_22399/g.63977 Transcript_22399/m.63977 type:complete len:205 (+) Transcript_22399:378-992(+)
MRNLQMSEAVMTPRSVLSFGSHRNTLLCSQKRTWALASRSRMSLSYTSHCWLSPPGTAPEKAIDPAGDGVAATLPPDAPGPAGAFDSDSCLCMCMGGAARVPPAACMLAGAGDTCGTAVGDGAAGGLGAVVRDSKAASTDDCMSIWNVGSENPLQTSCTKCCREKHPLYAPASSVSGMTDILLSSILPNTSMRGVDRLSVTMSV